MGFNVRRQLSTTQLLAPQWKGEENQKDRSEKTCGLRFSSVGKPKLHVQREQNKELVFSIPFLKESRASAHVTVTGENKGHNSVPSCFPSAIYG